MTDNQTPEQTIKEIADAAEEAAMQMTDRIVAAVNGQPLFSVAAALSAVMVSAINSSSDIPDPLKMPIFLMLADLANSVKVAFGITDEMLQQIALESSTVMIDTANMASDEATE